MSRPEKDDLPLTDRVKLQKSSIGDLQRNSVQFSSVSLLNASQVNHSKGHQSNIPVPGTSQMNAQFKPPMINGHHSDLTSPGMLKMNAQFASPVINEHHSGPTSPGTSHTYNSLNPAASPPNVAQTLAAIQGVPSSQTFNLSAIQGVPVHPILQQIDILNKLYTGSHAAAILPGGKRSQPSSGKSVVDLTEQEEIGKMKDDGVEEIVSSEVFSKYIHREVVPGCQPHPGDIVEAGPLAELLPPDPVYPLVEGITSEIVTSGKLSSLQLEGVLYACQRHQIILPNGRRAGFFIGDAAGVGKGRQIAGIILDNFSRKRTKHIWFSISADLVVDAKRDLSDLGCHIRVIDGCQELDKETRVLGLPADFKEGVIFSTYATLVSSVQKGGSFSGSKHSRLNQIVKWCGGEDFDGCLIFDECHKAKNFIPGKENNSTKVALSVAAIQKMLPRARVVYCSATGVTDVKNMAFMERLGLWGDGAPFKTFDGFLDTVHKKGLGMAEMLAMEMKMSGMYVSRGLSYKQAEFMTIEAPLTEDQRKMYDIATQVWYELRKALQSAIVRCNSSNTRLWSQYWSAHQRFFKQLCMGMKVPSIIKEAKEALDCGLCVVIGLQTTGEASLDSEMMKKGTLTGFMSLCREILSRFITDYFPTMVETKIAGAEPQPDEWSKKAKEMLLGFAKKIDLPNSPLDEIIDQLGGPASVAEMTGRRGRIVRHRSSDVPQYELRSADVDNTNVIDSLNVQERNHFMSGRKLVAIISDAASTGISLHADLRQANQCRRVHLTVELPWSADKAVQQLGRSHRSNQSSGPIYKLLTTDLGGERRFAASVARRLQSMGALTKGDRRAATGADLGEFNFDTPYGRNSLRIMYQHTCSKKLVPGIDLNKITEKYNFDQFLSMIQDSLILMGVADIENIKLGVSIKDSDAGDVSKFLNRILGLSVEKQNLMFSYFTEVLKLTIQHAKSEGRYNEGMLDITASSVEMVGEPQEIFNEINKGHTKTRLVELKIDRGMTWDMAVARSENHTGRSDGFYISKREMWGRKLILFATQAEKSTHLFKIARPNTGLSIYEEEKTELLHKYVPITPEKAEPLWRELYNQSEDQCIHGKTCKHRSTCRVGTRCYRMHLLCGSIVSHMSLLEATLSKFASKLNLSKSEANIRVVRIRLDNGERVVGVRYPEVLVRQVEKVLTDQKQSQTVSSDNDNQQASLSPYFNRLSSSQNGQNTTPSVDHENGSGPSGSSPFPPVKIKTEPGLDNPINSSQGTQPFNNQLQSPTSQESSKSKFLGAMVEPVAPVCLKCQKKAFRPPVTIRNFFKSATNSQINSDSGMDGSAIHARKQESDCLLDKDCNYGRKSDVCVTIVEKVEGVESLSFHLPGSVPDFVMKFNFDIFENIRLHGESATENKLVEIWKSVNSENLKVPCFSVKVSSTGCEECKILVKSDSDSTEISSASWKLDGASSTLTLRKGGSESTSLLSGKRRADNSTSMPLAKKRKQSSLMNSFAKAKSVTKKMEISCPICQIKFDSGTDNAEVNKHIDNCLIE